MNPFKVKRSLYILFRLIVERINRIANHQASFKSLSDSDQESLLRENANLLVSLRGAIFFDSRKNGAQQVLLSMGLGN